MKKPASAVIILGIVIASALFINSGVATAQTTYTTQSIQSSGIIQKGSLYQGTLLMQRTDDYYEIMNGTTGKPLIGGTDALAGVNGTSFSAVAQAGEGLLKDGGSLEIAAGIYISDAAVTIRGNTTIFGQGDSTFIQQQANIPTHVSMFTISYASNVEISKMWLDGNKANQFDNGDEMRQGILPLFAKNVWVHNMKITDFTETGYDPAWSDNCTIENSILTGSGDGDVWVDIDSTNQFVRNNTCDKIFVVDFGGSMANVWVSNNAASYIQVYQGGKNAPQKIFVLDNHITATPAIHFALYIQGCQNATIRGNVITGFSPATCYAGMQISSGRNHTITENTVTSCGIGIKSDTFSTSANMITRNDLRGNNSPISDNCTQTLDTVIYNLGIDISSWSEIP